MQIDFTYLETVSDGDEDFIKQFVDTFESTVNSLMEKMKNELENKDFDNLGKSAHQLKPSAKMLNLVSGDQLEELQHNPDIATDEMIASISSDCFAGLDELKSWAKQKGVEI